MRVETTRFGVIEIDPDTVITFTQPIIGFQTLRRFVLLPPPGGDGGEIRVRWLQSTESPDAAFLLMDPRTVYSGYAVELRAEELVELGAHAASELEVYSLLVVPEDHTQIRTNLKAPIVINPAQRLAKQTILDRQDYPIQFFLLTESREPGEGVEAAFPDKAGR